jgi:hypothetical protein
MAAFKQEGLTFLTFFLQAKVIDKALSTEASPQTEQPPPEGGDKEEDAEAP